VRQWVKPEVDFTTKIWVKNLNDAEFGALLWLLEEGRFRLGLGKPLGFGTVATDVTGWTPLNPGHRYLNHDATPGSTEELRANFESLWKGRASHLDAYRQAMQGWSDIPVEYPHVQAPSGYRPQGQPGYLWFVENERANSRQSLPPLGGKAPTLPWYRHSEDDLGRVEEVRRTRPCTTPSHGGRQGQTSRRPAAKRKPAAKAAPVGERRSGRVKKYFHDRGFGFIECDDGQEYFVHINDVKGATLAENMRVTFDVGRGKNGRPAAFNVSAPEVRS
jgi:CspA family cold shock protein